MTRGTRGVLLLLVLVGGAVLIGVGVFAGNNQNATALPEAAKEGEMSVEEAIAARRSVRQFTDAVPGERVIAQLCWATQGVTDTQRGYRAAPSAGATYPLELYVVTAEGVRRYVPDDHAFVDHIEGDLRGRLRAAALGQPFVESAPVVFVFAADVQRTAGRYGERAKRYVNMEVGHAAQNLLLQAEALGLAGVPVGAFRDEQADELLELPEGQQTLYLVPIGTPPAN